MNTLFHPVIAMTLTAGDVAAISGLFALWGGVLAAVCRYFVKAEIKIACDGLRLEWARERALALETRLAIHTTEASA